MANADWDLGQKLIEQGSCSMDQIREVLSLQDRMRKMGATTKSFPRVLLEKGYARREQLLKAGVLPADLPPPVEEKTAAVPAAARAPRRLAPWVLGGGLLALASLLILYARGSARTESPGPAPGLPSGLSEAELEANAKAHLDQISALAVQGGEFVNAPDVVTRLLAFIKAHAGTPWEDQARQLLREYRDRADVLAKGALEDLKTDEESLREQGRWVDLLALYRKFPPQFLETTDSGRAVQERMREASRQLLEIYSRDKAEVEKLLQEGKLSDALARAKAMELTAPPEKSEELFTLRARVERESRGVAEKARQEVADAYFKIDGPFRDAMSRRDGVRAAQVILQFLLAPWKPEQKPFVMVRGINYSEILKACDPWDPDALAALCEAGIPEADSPSRLGTGEGALLALRNAAWMAIFMRTYKGAYDAAVAAGLPVDLPGLGKGRFEKRNGKTVFVVETGEVLEPDTSPLGEDDLVALALRSGAQTARSLGQIGFFYFYACPDKQKPAYDYLVRAALKDARGVRLYLGGLGAAAESELKRRLETKFGAAQDLFKNGRRPQARKMLGDLLEYPDHPFVKSVRPEIEKLLYEIAEGSDREKRLYAEYKGKVEILDSALLKVTYDFEGKEQQDAFEMLAEEGPRKFKGRWRVDGGVLESASEASVLRWKTPVKGDLTVEYDLTPVEEAQNLVLDLYTHRGSGNHYAVVLGFDWVGKRDGDRDNSAEERFGMPRTCLLKYPVAVDKARWNEALTWDNWKARLVGKAAAAWKPVRGRTARIRVEREGRALRLLADRVLVWEGEDAEYTEGQLLFYSDSRCRIDNLSITFKP